MRPMTFIIGVILGSATALGVVLGIVLLMRWLMTLDPTLDQTVVRSDLPLRALVGYMLVFLGLSLIAGLAFIGELLRKPWRMPADFALGVAVTATLIGFLGDPASRVTDMAFLAVSAVLLAAGWALTWRSGWLSRLVKWLDE